MCCGVVGGGGGGLCVFIRIYIDVDTGELAKACQNSNWTRYISHILAFVDSSSYVGFCGLLFIFWLLWTPTHILAFVDSYSRSRKM